MWVEQMQKILFQVPSKPVSAQVELNNACNLSCKMCPRLDLPIDLEEMPLERAMEVFREFQRLGLQEMDLGGWGEVTWHKNFVPLLLYAKELGIRVSFTTNGLFLKGDLLKGVLDSGVKSITFSIDSLEKRKKDFSGHINSPAIKNLQEVLSYREEYGLRIKVNTLIQKSNSHEILELIDFMSELKIDLHVLFGPNAARDNQELRLPFSEETRIYDEIDEGIRQKRWQTIVTTPPRRYLSGNRKYHYGLGEKCPQTWQSFYVNQKGQITPCTLLPDLDLGRLSEFENLEDLWNSEKFLRFRRDQKTVCAGCDALKFESHGAI